MSSFFCRLVRETVCYFKIERIMNNPFTAKCIFSDLKLPSFQTRNLQVKKDYMCIQQNSIVQLEVFLIVDKVFL